MGMISVFAFVAIFLFTPLLAAQDIAVFVTEQSAEGESFWWENESPIFGGFDVAMQNEQSIRAKYPKSLAGVSSVIRTTPLTQNNALSLARFFGAKRGVVGTLVVEPLPVIIGMTGFAMTLEVQWFGMDGTRQFSIKTSSYHDDPERAKRDTYNKIAADLIRHIKVTHNQRQADVGQTAGANDVWVEATSSTQFFAFLRAVKGKGVVLWSTGGGAVVRFKSDPVAAVNALNIATQPDDRFAFKVRLDQE